jgi:HPt (histidine-containing phosphotransfer) domain-containing protein
LKEKKALEQSIVKLREMSQSAERVDDEIKRKLYTEQIQWWIKQAEEDITALKGQLRH